MLELKLISATQLTQLNAGLQHCLSNDVELLNLLEIIPPKSPEIAAFKIQDDLENKLVKYLDHYSFFIEVLSTFERLKLSESCEAGFEQLFFCRLCQGHHKSADYKPTTPAMDPLPQIISLVGAPCPNKCLNVIRGCYASLTGIVPQFSQLSQDFIELSRLLAQVTASVKEKPSGVFLKNHFLEEMHEWSNGLKDLPKDRLKAIKLQVSLALT